MANDTKQNKRHKRHAGVPTALVILLLVIAIVMGGLAGFAVARRTAPADNRLQEANERIIELENTLTLMGFPLDGDPNDWVFDDKATSNPASELAGVQGDDKAEEESVLWSDEGEIVTGELSDEADSVVLAEYDGGQLLSTDVIPVFNDQLAAQIFAGYSAEEVSESVLQSVLSSMVGERLVAQKAKEMGLDAVTDEDMQNIRAKADEAYRARIAYYAPFVKKDGMSQSQIDAAAEAYMKETEGATRESILEELMRQLPIEKYKEAITADVTLSDDEVSAYYQERLADQKASYDEYPEEYEYAHIDGTTILYNPEGYRAVRNLLLPFADSAQAEEAASLLSQIAALNPEKDAEEIRGLEAKLEPLYKPMEDIAAKIGDRLKAGESFLSLMDEYGQDELMQSEPLRTEGYYISDKSFLFSTEFIEGTMILERPGQVSTTLRSTAGLHMSEYVRDVPPGEVPLSDVFEAVKAEALDLRKNTYYEERVADLLDGANVKYYPERLH